MSFSILSIFIDAVIPVIVLVLLGYTVGPKLRLDVQTLSRAAYYILVPALVFDTISQAEISIAAATRMTVYIIIVHIACAFLGFLIARLLKRPPEVVAAYVLIAVFGNVANIGLPVIQFRFGEAARVPATLYFLAIFVIALIISILNSIPALSPPRYFFQPSPVFLP